MRQVLAIILTGTRHLSHLSGVRLELGVGRGPAPKCREERVAQEPEIGLIGRPWPAPGLHADHWPLEVTTSPSLGAGSGAGIPVDGLWGVSG